jgi:hypothetical protein
MTGLIRLKHQSVIHPQVFRVRAQVAAAISSDRDFLIIVLFKPPNDSRAKVQRSSRIGERDAELFALASKQFAG